MSGAHLYWSSFFKIGRVDLAGTLVEDPFITGGTATGPAVDDAHVYWANQTGPDNRIRLGKPTLDKQKGTAILPAKVHGPGALELRGMGVRAAEEEAFQAGTVELRVRTEGKKRRTLNREGSVTVKARVTNTPTGGAPHTDSRKITLVKRG